ncbi:multimerin-2 [Protopterus annectens]|uniref:multimerin-2 n=1 Tax=Protopterus annectens TaxID=7888 RepID=UPI001CF9B508|nr:multimerin-2 [Protopterus annectens]
MMLTVKVLCSCLLMQLACMETNTRVHGILDHDRNTQFYDASGNAIHRHSRIALEAQTEHGIEDSQREGSHFSTGTSDMHVLQSSNRKPGVLYNAGRRGNWCQSSYIKVITYTSSCGTEKYIIKSQQPCPNGTPDCEVVMYKIASKPVYKVHQKEETVYLPWECCPGYTGSNCEHKVADTSHNPRQMEAVGQTTSTYENPHKVTEKVKEHKARLQGLQNDIHLATSNLQDLQRPLDFNITSVLGMNQSSTEFKDKLLQQIVLPYLEIFLRDHVNPMWESFNKSLQNLSNMVKNLSQDIEENKKNIGMLYKQSVPKEELQEFGTKFESKLQENILRLDNVQREMGKQLHNQQAGIQYNLTMIKAETDLKLKRNNKMINFSLLNDSITEILSEQNKLRTEIQAVNNSVMVISKWNLCSLCASCDDQVKMQISVDKLNQTVNSHSAQINELCENGSVEKLNEKFRDLNNTFDNIAKELRVSLVEMMLTVENDKDNIQKQILDLNSTFLNQVENHEDILSEVVTINNTLNTLVQQFDNSYEKVDTCTLECQTLSISISGLEEEQRNLNSSIDELWAHVEELKQREDDPRNRLENLSEDLSVAFQQVQQSVSSQQHQSRNIIYNVSLLQSQSSYYMQELIHQKEVEAIIKSHIKDLNSSFTSLLDDAVRHSIVLEALLGEDILDVFSEDNPKALQMSLTKLYEVLNEALKNISRQSITLDLLHKKLLSLETEKVSRNESTEYAGHFELEERHSEKDTEVQHIEPNFETTSNRHSEDNDIASMKQHIELLSIKIQNLQNKCSTQASMFNTSFVDHVTLLSELINTLRLNMSSLKEMFDEHISLFQNLFGNTDEFVSANMSLNITAIHSIMAKQIKRQQKKEEEHNLQKNGMWNSDTQAPKNIFSGNSRNNYHLFRNASPVAFYVGLSERTDTKKMVRFDRLLLNYGNKYSPEEGYFKAPYRGVYMFALSLSSNNGSILGQLITDGKQILLLQSTTKKKRNTIPVTNFALLELKKGQAVWVELSQASVTKTSLPQVTFGGFLLFRT